MNTLCSALLAVAEARSGAEPLGEGTKYAVVSLQLLVLCGESGEGNPVRARSSRRATQPVHPCMGQAEPTSTRAGGWTAMGWSRARLRPMVQHRRNLQVHSLRARS